MNNNDDEEVFHSIHSGGYNEQPQSELVYRQIQINNRTETTVMASIYFLLAALFMYGNWNQHEDCISLKKVTTFYAYYCFFLFLIRICLFIPFTNKHIQYQKYVEYGLILYQTFEMISSISFLFLMTYSFLKDEPCGQLRIITKFYLFAIYTCLIFMSCVIACLQAAIRGSQIE